LTCKTMTIAGWLAMISAFFTLPLMYLSFRLEGRIDATASIIQTVMQLAGTLLFVALLLYFRKLLHAQFTFHDTDRSIGLMIKAGVIAGVLTVLSLYVTSLKETTALAVIVILVAQGIVQVQFGYKLLKLPDDLGGMLKPFCYANMATGIMIASVVLIPVGALVSAITDLMLGTIFFNIARRVKESEPGRAVP
jgi:hypothetical protein